MPNLTRNHESFLAVGLSVFLLASILGTAAAILTLGDGWLSTAAPVLRWDIILLSNSVFLFVIAWTDFPEKIRRSPAARVQVQCWTVWQVLLGVLAFMTARRMNLIVTFAVLCGCGIALLAYSVGAVYRYWRT